MGAPMIFTDLAPLKKFIVTDILSNNALNKYTVGYIASVIPTLRNERPYVHVVGVITRIGKSGKDRIQIKEFYAAPIVYKDLLPKSPYDNATHILTKDECVNVLKMDNTEFLSWAYTNITLVEKYNIRVLWPDALDKATSRIKSAAQNYPEYTKKEIHALVGSTVTRSTFLERLRLMQSFVRDSMQKDIYSYNIYMLEAHSKFASVLGDAELYSKITGHLDIVKTGKKFPNDLLTESKNVSDKYKNSGYWV
jgi:hypothetical protein